MLLHQTEVDNTLTSNSNLQHTTLFNDLKTTQVPKRVKYYTCICGFEAILVAQKLDMKQFTLTKKVTILFTGKKSDTKWLLHYVKLLVPDWSKT